MYYILLLLMCIVGTVTATATTTATTTTATNTTVCVSQDGTCVVKGNSTNPTVCPDDKIMLEPTYPCGDPLLECCVAVEGMMLVQTCEEQDGTCRAQGTNCTHGTIDEFTCEVTNDACCAPAPPQTCSSHGGLCVDDTACTSETMLKEGLTCPGANFMCCVPVTCDNQGGTCLGTDDHCSLMEGAFNTALPCEEEGLQCCIPVDGRTTHDPCLVQDSENTCQPEATGCTEEGTVVDDTLTCAASEAEVCCVKVEPRTMQDTCLVQDPEKNTCQPEATGCTETEKETVLAEDLTCAASGEVCCVPVDGRTMHDTCVSQDPAGTCQAQGTNCTEGMVLDEDLTCTASEVCCVPVPATCDNQGGTCLDTDAHCTLMAGNFNNASLPCAEDGLKCCMPELDGRMVDDMDDDVDNSVTSSEETSESSVNATSDDLLLLGEQDPCYMPNQILENGTIKVIENCTSMVECQSFCRKTDDCQSLSFVPLIDLCFLKNDDHDAPTELEGAISAPVDCEYGMEYWTTQQQTGRSSYNRGDKYMSMGCWRDIVGRRAIPTLENTPSVAGILDGRYQQRRDPIEKCYKAAKKLGYMVFAVQNGGWCAASASAWHTYKMWGQSNACRPDGAGGNNANQVYRIISRNPTRKVFTENSGTIKSTNYPSRYTSNENILFEISTQCSQLYLQFRDFNLEWNYDFLKIYKGNTAKKQYLKVTLSGNRRPAPVSISGGKALLWFTSDSASQGRGFTLFYRGSNCGRCYGRHCPDIYGTCEQRLGTCQKQLTQCHRGRYGYRG